MDNLKKINNILINLEDISTVEEVVDELAFCEQVKKSTSASLPPAPIQCKVTMKTTGRVIFVKATLDDFPHV